MCVLLHTCTYICINSIICVSVVVSLYVQPLFWLFNDRLCVCIIILVTVVTDHPEVRHLNTYVRGPLCAAGPNRWRDLGLILMGESSRNELSIIEYNHQSNISGCCDKMFALWLERDPEATWKKLIAALKDNHLETIASDLTKIIR